MLRFAPSRSRRAVTAVVAVMAAVVVAVSACSSGASDGKPTAASSSPNSSLLPTAPGVVKDSIEDVNSTKDMTGVVTTYSRDNNPYVQLIPYVCPFLPDTLTRDKLGMETKQTGFGGQHTLLQICSMAGPSGPHYEQIGITVTLQAISFADDSSSPTHTNVARNVPIWRNVTGTLYQNAGDVREDIEYCNLVWGTFYGSAAVTVYSRNGYRADPCVKAKEFAPLVAPLLPSKPIQMRATEG